MIDANDLVTSDQPEFPADLQEVAEAAGAKFVPTALKSSFGWGRIAEKTVTENGGDASLITDFLRGLVLVETPEQARAALDSVIKKFGRAEKPPSDRTCCRPASTPCSRATSPGTPTSS